MREHVWSEGWSASVVNAVPQILQHEESFEVRAGAKRKFFYFDEDASRRAVSGRPSKKQALQLAQAYLTKVNHERGDDDALRPDQTDGR